MNLSWFVSVGDLLQPRNCHWETTAEKYLAYEAVFIWMPLRHGRLQTSESSSSASIVRLLYFVSSAVGFLPLILSLPCCKPPHMISILLGMLYLPSDIFVKTMRISCHQDWLSGLWQSLESCSQEIETPVPVNHHIANAWSRFRDLKRVLTDIKLPASLQRSFQFHWNCSSLQFSPIRTVQNWTGSRNCSMYWLWQNELELQ